MKEKKWKKCKKKTKTKETRCVISIYFVHIISFPHVHVFFFSLKCQNGIIVQIIIKVVATKKL